MKASSLKSTVALAAMLAAMATVPAHAVQVAFSGAIGAGTPTGNDTGTDGMGDHWQTLNGPANTNSMFGMSNSAAVPEPFNPLNNTSGLGDWTTSFQLTINKAQGGDGFKGIIQAPVASGLANNFTVKPVLADPSTWVTWDVSYNLMDGNGFFQQVLFTAPAGTRLDQGVNFNTNVNFAGVFTNDSGWAASFDDRFQAVAVSTVPEPGSFALLGLGLLGLVGVNRKKLG